MAATQRPTDLLRKPFGHLPRPPAARLRLRACEYELVLVDSVPSRTRRLSLVHFTEIHDLGQPPERPIKRRCSLRIYRNRHARMPIQLPLKEVSASRKTRADQSRNLKQVPLAASPWFGPPRAAPEGRPTGCR